MFKNRKLNLFLIGTLAVALIAVLTLTVVPSAAAPTNNADASTDYAQRHPGISNPSIEKALGSDWYQRHGSEVASLPALGTTDYFQRHPELGNLSVGKAMDPSGSDWYQRHASESVTVSAADTSDYYLRHLSR